jgi:cytosine/adenosine deaminase-related metal-dependent hydrolase
VTVGLGVDGSSSNDSGHLLSEARQALLLQRLREGAEACAARDMLRIATRSGAAVLGRGDHLGQLAPGFQGDCAAFPVNDLWHAGAGQDPVASLLFCHSERASYTLVGGDVLVDGGRIVSFDVERELDLHATMVRRLVNGERAS